MSEELLEAAAGALGPLCGEVVFLGGSAVHLWLTDPAAPATRATDDVDVISAVSTRPGYYALGERLRARGFREASDSKVICRWYHDESGTVLDVMPRDEDVLGFSNPWYGVAIRTAVERTLSSGAAIVAAAPPALIATKLAAWNGRGRGDLLRSLDLHDVLVLVDGRSELAQEVASAPSDLCAFVATEFRTVSEHPYFEYLLDGALHGYGALAARRGEELRVRVEAVIAAAELGVPRDGR